jgi:hypothetical protein
MGLMIIYHKTKYMELSNSPTKEKYIIINSYNIKIMEFKYLGFLISNNNSIIVDMYHRILVGTCYYGLRNLLQSILLNKVTKSKSIKLS